jgi:protoporphyrinogen oxidase
MTVHEDAPIVVLGSGFAAFGAGHRLDSEGLTYIAFDKNDYPGGHTATHVTPAGYLFDDGPHVSFTKNERIQDILADAVDGRFETVPIGLENYWQGRYITHPVQVNLHGLPSDLVVKILVDLVAAQAAGEPPVADYEAWCRAAFGDTFAETFPLVYARKYHTTDAANLTTDWLGPRMYRPTLEEALRGALEPTPVTELHYVTHFRYPTHGGYAAYLARWASTADLRLGHEVVGIDPREREIRFANGFRQRYRQLISSIPLPELVPMLDGAPSDVVAASRRLAFTSVVMVNLGVTRLELPDAHILYVYDEDIVFPRVSFPHRLSPHVTPEGRRSLQVEIYFSDKYRPLTVPPESLIDRVVADLLRCGILGSEDEIEYREARLARYGNVIYDRDRGPAVQAIADHLAEVAIVACGRYGEWNHLWTDEAFESGERAAEAILEASPA